MSISSPVACPGYQDLLSDDVNHKMFWDEEILNDTAKIKKGACAIIAIVERLNEVQDMKGFDEY